MIIIYIPKQDIVVNMLSTCFECSLRLKLAVTGRPLIVQLAKPFRYLADFLPTFYSYINRSVCHGQVVAGFQGILINRFRGMKKLHSFVWS